MSDIATRTPQQELVAQIRSDGFQKEVAIALKGSGIAPEKFVRVAVTAINENPDLVTADRASLFGALMRCATDNLLPDGREAAIPMFGKKATYMPMVVGLRRIAAEYGWSIIAFIVHENDGFDPDFENHKANYKPARLGTDPGAAQGAYALGQHRDGRRQLEVMTLQEIEAVRAVSRAKNSGPWVDWWGEMARKTVVRRLFKALPFDPKDRDRIDRVLAAATDVDTGERVDLLYGAGATFTIPKEDSPARTGDRTPQPPTAAASDQQASGDLVAGDPEATGPEPEDGEWSEATQEVPPEEPPADEPRFPSGTYKDKTISEIYALGDEGVLFLRWAFASSRLEPMRSALDRFAETHPEVKA